MLMLPNWTVRVCRRDFRCSNRATHQETILESAAASMQVFPALGYPHGKPAHVNNRLVNVNPVRQKMRGGTTLRQPGEIDKRFPCRLPRTNQQQQMSRRPRFAGQIRQPFADCCHGRFLAHTAWLMAAISSADNARVP